MPDILKEVFGDHSSQRLQVRAERQLPQWIYCVQYRETDFNFVSRLMEEEGIYYYFKHEDGPDTHGAGRLDQRARSRQPTSAGCLQFSDAAGRAIRRRAHQRVDGQPRDAAGHVRAAPTTTSRSRASSCRSTAARQARACAWPSYEVYDYPGDYLEAQRRRAYARPRIEELQAQFERCSGATNAAAWRAGHLFTLTGHPRDDQNARVSGRRRPSTRCASASTSRGEAPAPSFGCTVRRARQPTQPFRPQRITPKPFVHGPQTAMVVGPAGERSTPTSTAG